MSSLSNAKVKRILHVFIKEPIAGQVKKNLACQIGEHQAYLKYKAEVITFLGQLTGLQNCHVRICYSPQDAGDAIKFWLLPLFKGEIIADNRTDHFLYKPEQSAEIISLDFISTKSGLSSLTQITTLTSEALEQGFKSVAFTGTNCPECGARWINMAMMLAERETLHHIVGKTTNNSPYLSIYNSLINDKSTYQVTHLPPLPKIKSEDDWNQAIESAIGAKLKKAYLLYNDIEAV